MAYIYAYHIQRVTASIKHGRTYARHIYKKNRQFNTSHTSRHRQFRTCCNILEWQISGCMMCACVAMSPLPSIRQGESNAIAILSPRTSNQTGYSSSQHCTQSSSQRLYSATLLRIQTWSDKKIWEQGYYRHYQVLHYNSNRRM